jgi:hypothetical protein
MPDALNPGCIPVDPGKPSSHLLSKAGFDVLQVLMRISTLKTPEEPIQNPHSDPTDSGTYGGF